MAELQFYIHSWRRTFLRKWYLSRDLKVRKEAIILSQGSLSQAEGLKVLLNRSRHVPDLFKEQQGGWSGWMRGSEWTVVGKEVSTDHSLKAIARSLPFITSEMGSHLVNRGVTWSELDYRIDSQHSYYLRDKRRIGEMSQWAIVINQARDDGYLRIEVVEMC